MTAQPEFQAACGERDLTQLLTMAKDHESMCDRLLSTTRSFEGQLRALRSEHEALKAEAQALRRCLHKSGVLQVGAIEQELEQYGSGLVDCTNGSSGFESAASTTAVSFASTGSAASGSDGSSAAGGDACTNCSTPVRVGVQFSGQFTGDSDVHMNEPLHCRGRSAEKSGEEIPRNRGLVDRWRSRSSGAGGCSRSRSRSSSNSRDKKQNPMPSPLRQRPAKQAGADEADSRRSSPKRDSSGDEDDLYEICKPLLDKDAGMLEQQQAYRRVARVLSSMRAVPRTWRGPGTPLSEAVRSGRVDFARLLLQAGVEVNDRDDKGVGALHIATFDGDIDLCRVLLAARAEVDLQDCVGQTPLFFAPTRRICRLLVEQFADVSALNFKGQTALHLAGRAGLHDVLSWLAQRTCKSVVEHKDIYGATAYYYLQHGVEGVPRERTRSGVKPLSPVPVRTTDSSKGSPPSPPHTGSFSGVGPAGREDRKTPDRWRKNEQGLQMESFGNGHGDGDIVPVAANKSSMMGKLKVKNGHSQSARTFNLRSDSPQKKNGQLPMSARAYKSATLLGSSGGVMPARQAPTFGVPRQLVAGGRGQQFDPRQAWGAGGSSPRRAIGNGVPAKGLNGQISSLSAFAAAKSSGGPAVSGFGGTNFPQGKVLRGRGGGRGLLAKASSRDGKRGVHRPSLSGVAEADEEDERDEDEHNSANVRHQADSSTQPSQSKPNLENSERGVEHERKNEEAGEVSGGGQRRQVSHVATALSTAMDAAEAVATASMATAMEAAAAVATAAVATAAELEHASSTPESPASEAAASEVSTLDADTAAVGKDSAATVASSDNAGADQDVYPVVGGQAGDASADSPAQDEEGLLSSPAQASTESPVQEEEGLLNDEEAF